MKKLTIILLIFSLFLSGCSVSVAVEESRTAPPDSAETTALTTEESTTPPTSETETTEPATEPPVVTGQIYLYGETHNDPECIEKELILWGEFYATGMRDLFIEYPFYTAEYLNAWMKADTEEILYELYEDSEGTLAHSEVFLYFFRRIKAEYPETVFHGTDVGHQYYSIGRRYLEYLKATGREGSAAYARAEEIIRQGEEYYKKRDHVYRENCMAENFIWAFGQMEGKDIMGIYGGAHTDPRMPNHTGQVDSMAKQLAAHYGEALHTKQLYHRDPMGTDIITVAGRDYEATYFGKYEYQGNLEISFVEYWRLENAYEDFAACSKLNELLSYDSFPMEIQEGHIYLIESTYRDGTVKRKFYIADSTIFYGKFPALQWIHVKED